jgi:hypothetical protein
MARAPDTELSEHVFTIELERQIWRVAREFGGQEFGGQYTEFDYLIGDWLSRFQFRLQNG